MTVEEFVHNEVFDRWARTELGLHSIADEYMGLSNEELVKLISDGIEARLAEFRSELLRDDGFKT
jgi:hypothetical protein